MKNLLFLFFVLVIITIPIITVSAATTSVSFNSDNSSVSCGDTFVSTITITSNNIINGLQLSPHFDEEIFEFQKAELKDPNEYALFGASAESIEILSLNGSKVPLVLQMIWKVKDNVQTDDYSISASPIQISYMENDDIENIEVDNLQVHINGISKQNNILWIVVPGISIIAIGFIVFTIIKKH